jgi:hypothetical protein
MTYSLYQYADKIAKCHFNTLKARIKNEQLPSNHIVTRLGRTYSIEIVQGSENCRACDNIHHAALEFQEKSKNLNVDFNRELAAKLCVKWDIDTLKFFKMMGVK